MLRTMRKINNRETEALRVSAEISKIYGRPFDPQDKKLINNILVHMDETADTYGEGWLEVKGQIIDFSIENK